MTDKQKRGSLDRELSRLILYKTLSRDFLSQPHTEQEVLDAFRAFQCPDEVLADEDTMYALGLLGKRIEHTRRECQRRLHVAEAAVECLKTFLSDLPPDAPTDPAARLLMRCDSRFHTQTHTQLHPPTHIHTLTYIHTLCMYPVHTCTYPIDCHQRDVSQQATSRHVHPL